MSTRPITGTAMRNTDPHQNTSSSAPPTSGPIAAPVEKLITQMLIAVVRSRGSGNMFEMSDKVDGARVAAAIPRSARVAMSIAGVEENAARIDTTPNAAAPIRSSRRRPILSPRRPIGINQPASMKP